MKLLRNILGWSFLLLIPAGALWALSPLGVYLSDYAFRTPNVFWRLFPAAPLLMSLGLAGAFFFSMREKGTLTKVGFWTVVVGVVLTVAGVFGRFYLALDDEFILTAPAWRLLRTGLFVFAAGAVLFGASAARERSLPLWGVFPFAVASIAGVISVWRDFGEVGAAMWISFGVGFSWLGLALLVERILRYSRARRSSAKVGGSPSSKTPATHI